MFSRKKAIYLHRLTVFRYAMKSEIEERAVFVSFCIEQYAKAKNMPTEDVVNLFGKYELTEYLCEFYDELHTHGHNWLIFSKSVKNTLNVCKVATMHLPLMRTINAL